ncbi:MAG: YbaK/EbsC family protein [Salinirussus sp.]
MHPRAEAFADCAAEKHGLDIEVHEFEEGTKTAEDAAERVGCAVEQIASGLVFEADGQPVMVITSGANRVNETALAAYLDADSVAMADPELVRETTGFGIGGVPPFCHERHLRVLIDPTLTQQDVVWAAAGTPEAIFPIKPETLVDVAEATPADVTE